MRCYLKSNLTVVMAFATLFNVVSARPASAQEIVPRVCPDLLGPRPIVIDGIVFSGVTFIKKYPTVLNGGYYETSPPDPVSDDGRWVWMHAAVSLL